MTQLATSRQLFALFCATGYDTRGLPIGKELASDLIDRGKSGEDITPYILEVAKANNMTLECKRNVAAKKDWQKVWDKAHAAGMEAGRNHNPTPMIVTQYKDVTAGMFSPITEEDEIEQQWYEPGGVCGFAWINLSHANHSFCKWLKENGIGRKDDYYGGVTIWVKEFGQSYERKLAYAEACAKVISEEVPDLKRCYVNSRLD